MAKEENEDEKEDKKKKKRPIAGSLDDLKKLVQKVYGAGAIMQGRNTIVKVDSFPTGVATIDIALGCGGLPRGRIIEIFGYESSGKTTTCLHLIAACQKHFFADRQRNGIAAFIDAEHAFDPTWAAKCGVDIENLLFSQPDSGEEAFDIAEMMAESGQVDLIIVDSVASMTPMKELEGDVGDAVMGAQARMMSQGLRKIKGKANKSKTTIIFINQVRQKIGIVFGNPDVTPGGNALRFFTSVRAQIVKGPSVKDGGETVGFKPTLKLIKNKCAAPFTSAEYMICVGNPKLPIYGIDELSALIDAGAILGFITKKSSYFYFDEIKLGNGLDSATDYVRKHPELQATLKEKIYGSLTQVAIVIPIDSELDDEESLSDDILDQ